MSGPGMIPLPPAPIGRLQPVHNVAGEDQRRVPLRPPSPPTPTHHRNLGAPPNVRALEATRNRGWRRLFAGSPSRIPGGIGRGDTLNGSVAIVVALALIALAILSESFLFGIFAVGITVYAGVKLLCPCGNRNDP